MNVGWNAVSIAVPAETLPEEVRARRPTVRTSVIGESPSVAAVAASRMKPAEQKIQVPIAVKSALRPISAFVFRRGTFAFPA
jgi:hypothetical protein